MKVTASAQKRFLQCLPSAFLTSVSSSNEYAERGSAGHAYLEGAAMGLKGKDAFIGVPDEHVKMCESIDVDALMSNLCATRPEMAYAIDFVNRKARVIGQSIGRSYGELGPTEVAGSTDLIAQRPNGIMVVRDYKFGQAPAPTDPQNLFFCAALYLLDGIDEFESQVVSIQAEGPQMGQFTIDSAMIDMFQIEAYIETMADACKRAIKAQAEWLETGVANVKTGSWCDYCGCKAAGSCPAYAGLAKSMMSDITSLNDRLALLTDEEKGAAWIKLKAVKSVVEMMEAGLKGMCSEEAPLPISDEKEVRPVYQTKTSLSAEALLKLAKELGASVTEIDNCHRTTTYPVYRIVNRKQRKENDQG